MNEIDLRRFDLNLLVVFEVLMAERNVTQAALRLGRTQSAVSHALARLRSQLGDPIVPSGLRRPSGVIAEPIGALRWRCFARADHPAFERWGAATWARWPHVVVRVGDDLESPIDRAASRAGLARTIAGWVPN